MSLNLEKKCNRDTSSKASCFLKCVATFEFIVALVITRNVLDITLPATELLQAKGNDIFDGLKLICSLKNLAVIMRNSVDIYHNKWYNAPLSLSEKVEVVEAKPRVCRLQINRSNVPSESVSDYFKKTITIPLLDHLVNDLLTRFDETAIIAYNGLTIIPTKMISLVNPSNEKLRICWKEKFKAFAEFYADDLPNFFGIDGELDLWERHWLLSTSYVPDNISTTLKAISYPGFENIRAALRILATIPVTSCECERSFSAMRRQKLYP